MRSGGEAHLSSRKEWFHGPSTDPKLISPAPTMRALKGVRASECASVEKLERVSGGCTPERAGSTLLPENGSSAMEVVRLSSGVNQEWAWGRQVYHTT